MDPALQRVRDALREHGIAEDTILIFTTDHGPPFQRAKKTCYESGVETALLVEGPEVPAGERRDAVVPNIDLFATMLDYADAGWPSDRDVQSLRPLLGGSGSFTEREYTFLEHTWHCLPLPSRAVRADRCKYIRSFAPLPFDHDYPEEALYDITEDPNERENLLDNPDPSHLAVAAELRTALAEWMDATGDPLAEGCIPMPNDDRNWLDEVRSSGD